MLFNNSFDIVLFEQYLRDKHNLNEHSVYVYIKSAEFFLLTNPDVNNIDDYNKFIIKHAIKKRSSHVYSVLKAFIKFIVDDVAQRNRMLEELIKPEINYTKKFERKHLSEKEIVAVINNMKKLKHKIIALVQDLTGVRAGDIMRIRHGNIVPEIYDNTNVLKLIIYGKGNVRNVVYIHDAIVQELIMQYIIKNVNNTGYYFIIDKTRIKDLKFKERKMYKANHMAYYRDLKQAMDKVGIDGKDFATHDYRRCYARRVWDRYKDVHVLQELLNHKNPATTMRYLKQSGLQNVEYHKQMQS